MNERKRGKYSKSQMASEETKNEDCCRLKLNGIKPRKFKNRLIVLIICP